MGRLSTFYLIRKLLMFQHFFKLIKVLKIKKGLKLVFSRGRDEGTSGKYDMLKIQILK